MKSSYKSIGSYIQKVDNRNNDLKVLKLLGLSMTKEFRETTSNTIGTDMSVYKVMKKNQFACDFMSPIRVNKLPVVLKLDDEPNLVSPAYPVFEIRDTDELDPEYLMMWFRRSEFDRYVTFKCDAAIRGGYDWEELLETKIPVPTINKQREIVAEYRTIQKQIEINKSLIRDSESAIETIYRHWFINFEFPDINGMPYKSSGGVLTPTSSGDREIPPGWKIKPFTDVLRLSGGGTPDTNTKEYWGGAIPFFTPADVVDNYFAICTEKSITDLGLKNSSTRLYPKFTVFVTARGTVGAISIAGCDMAMNQSCYAITGTNEMNQFFVHQLALESISKLKMEALGAVFSALVTKDFETQEIIEPDHRLISLYGEKVSPIYEYILNKARQNNKLNQLRDLLLSKLATVEN